MNSAYQSLFLALSSIYERREAQAIARNIFEDVFGLTFTEICMGKDKELSEHDYKHLQNITVRLLSGEPVQYVLGQAYFLGKLFEVNPSTLIPRPETEDLVQYLFSHPISERVHNYLDVGTGTGCIAISIALRKSQNDVKAWDIDEKTLETARNNAYRHDARVKFECQDILNPFVADSIPKDWIGNYILVSNPPYVCESEKKDIKKHVKEFEPAKALFVADEQPLCFYEALANIARRTNPIAIFCELNERYAEQVSLLFQEKGYKNSVIHKDRFEKERFLTAFKI